MKTITAGSLRFGQLNEDGDYITLKKLKGHIALGLSVLPSILPSATNYKYVFEISLMDSAQKLLICGFF